MARPQKEGLEYFPLDVDTDQDDKLVVPIAKHGMLGWGVIVKLMMEVYKNGYYYPWTEKELYVFPFKIGVDTEKVSEIVIDCINSGFFCINQYKRNQILTSYGFQKRFLLATTRRKDATINDRYLVQKELMPTETELLHTETNELSVESTQSKRKESKEKVKEIKVEEITNTSPPDSFDNILSLLKKYEVEKYTAYSIEILGSYVGVVEFAVVEIAIKKAEKKHVNYAVNIIEGWIKEGKTTKEQVMPKPPTNIRNNQPNRKDKIPMFKAEDQDEPMSAEAKEEIKRQMRELGKGRSVGA